MIDNIRTTEARPVHTLCRSRGIFLRRRGRLLRSGLGFRCFLRSGSGLLCWVGGFGRAFCYAAAFGLAEDFLFFDDCRSLCDRCQHGFRRKIATLGRTAAGVLALRFVPVLALGLAAVFLVAVVAFLGPGLAFVVAVFFGRVVLVAVLVLVAAAFCR